jgi:hypothetical protein
MASALLYQISEVFGGAFFFKKATARFVKLIGVYHVKIF